VSQKVERAPRLPIKLSAELHHPAFKTSGMTRNLSDGGACVEVAQPIIEGTMLDVILFVVEDDIETEGGSRLALKASVQWMAESDRGYQVGLKWHEPTAQQITSLTRALAAIDPEQKA
jgi:hypothetical protein